MNTCRSGYVKPIEINEEQLEEFRAAAQDMWRNKRTENVINFLCKYFQVQSCRVVLGNENCYLKNSRRIVIDKYSVVSLLHEFYHYASYFVNGLKRTEVAARTFSVSLYAKAFPELYKKMVAADRLIWY